MVSYPHNYTSSCTAQDTVPVISNVKRPWLSPDSIAVLDKKRDARLRGSTDERRKYKGIFKARAKAYLEEYYNGLADQAEEGIKHHNLRSAFRTIRTLTTSPAHCHSGHNSTIPVTRSDGRPCHTVEETMECWRSHYENALNHPPANLCRSWTLLPTTLLLTLIFLSMPQVQVRSGAQSENPETGCSRSGWHSTRVAEIRGSTGRFCPSRPLLSGVKDREGSSRMARGHNCLTVQRKRFAHIL